MKQAKKNRKTPSKRPRGRPPLHKNKENLTPVFNKQKLRNKKPLEKVKNGLTQLLNAGEDLVKKEVTSGEKDYVSLFREMSTYKFPALSPYFKPLFRFH